MHEALSHANTAHPSSLHLVTELVDDSPEDTIVQERTRADETLKSSGKPDAWALERAFSGFELQADKLSDAYNVTGNRLEDGKGGVYKLSITIPGQFRAEGPTTVNIGLSPDGTPIWQIDGPEIDAGYEAVLVEMIEDTIAEARHA